MNTYIDIHALHTLPPNNINRDDTGAPKTATFGGVERQRVSSQAWKRAIRKDFENYLQPDQLGTRTRRVVAKILDAVKEIKPDADLEQTAKDIEEVLKAGKIKITPAPKKDDDGKETFGLSGYLLFLSANQVKNVAKYVLANPGTKPSKKEASELLDEGHSVDVAMFGRMVADEATYNVDASVQVAHALGVSGAMPEFDYFTAVDDVVAGAEESGAGMIGTVQMMSSTLYRYATVDLPLLKENLGSAEAAVEATSAFIKAFITSMPTGKQNTFANRTLPEAVVVSVRSDRPVSLVNAFEEAIPSNAANRRLEAATRLATEAQEIVEMYDAPAEKSWVISHSQLAPALSGVGERVSREELLQQLEVFLTARVNA